MEEAILELKETDFKELFADDKKEEKVYIRDVTIDSDIEMMIPDAYVSNIQERLNLYQSLDKLENEEAIQKFCEQIKDRFGPIPSQVEELLNGLRLRWVAKRLGFERVVLKKKNCNVILFRIRLLHF